VSVLSTTRALTCWCTSSGIPNHWSGLIWSKQGAHQ